MDHPATSDVLIVGGGAVGASVAYFLKAELGFPGNVVVLERDPSYAKAATALSASGLRTQFSSPLNVKMSLFGGQFLREAPERLDRDLHFHENGYLFLAGTADQAEEMRINHRMQGSLGADVVLLDPSALVERFPYLNNSGVQLGSLGRSGEGWFDSMGLLNALKARARDAGAVFVHAEAQALNCTWGTARGATLSDGTEISCGTLVLAAGTRSPELAERAGLSLPVEPRKRMVWTFQAQGGPLAQMPLTILPNGVYCRPEGGQFLCGTSPEVDPKVTPDDFEPRYDEFDTALWPALAAQFPHFEAVKTTGCWVGQYDMCTLDQNAILGPHTDIPNLLLATGFSGHGLQQSPAVGRGLAEWIALGGYSSLELSDLGHGRVAHGTQQIETAIV